MARSFSFHPAAAEVLEAQAWYARRSEIAAEAFGFEVDLVVRRVTEMPERYAKHLSGTRRIVFPRFPFNLVYLVSDEAVQVVAVAHQRRRPGYWIRRTEGAV